MRMTRPEELKKLIKRIEESAPEGYIPFFFPIAYHGKEPGVSKGISWKHVDSRLTPNEAIERLEKGYNVGIAAMNNDLWVNVDIDDARFVNDLKPTFIVQTRRGYGRHGFYFAIKGDNDFPTNIPTEFGEVRSDSQYVVAPGSYVPVTEEEMIKKVADGKITEEMKEEILSNPDKGIYKVISDVPISNITFEELPKIFHKKAKENKENEERLRKLKIPLNPIERKGNHSALFDLDIRDIIPSHDRSSRIPHPLHDSDTGKNFSLGDGVAQCWRHLVSLNALQFLVVKSGYLSCDQAGSGHSGSGASYVTGNDGAIFYAWLEAKKSGYIPMNDPLPSRAINYIALKHNVCPENNINAEGMLLPKDYNKVLKIVEEVY